MAIQLIQLLFFCSQGAAVVLQKGEFTLIILSLVIENPMFAILLAITSIPECHNSQFNQVDQYHIMLLLGHQRVRPTTSRKHLFNNMGCIIIKVTILLVKYASGFSLWVTPVDLCNIVYVFTPEAPSGFSPHSFFEEVFWPDGRSLTQSLFSFCFRGEGAASPLNSRRRRLGGALIPTLRETN